MAAGFDSQSRSIESVLLNDSIESIHKAFVFLKRIHESRSIGMNRPNESDCPKLESSRLQLGR